MQVALVAVFALFLPIRVLAQVQQTASGDQLKQVLDTSNAPVETLDQEGGAPFHLVARIEQFNPDGTPNGNGTLDELWESPKRYRQTLTLPQIEEIKKPDGTESFQQVSSPLRRKLIEVDSGAQAWRTGEWVVFGENPGSVLKPFYLRPPASNRVLRAMNLRRG